MTWLRLYGGIDLAGLAVISMNKVGHMRSAEESSYPALFRLVELDFCRMHEAQRWTRRL